MFGYLVKSTFQSIELSTIFIPYLFAFICIDKHTRNTFGIEESRMLLFYPPIITDCNIACTFRFTIMTLETGLSISISFQKAEEVRVHRAGLILIFIFILILIFLIIHFRTKKDAAGVFFVR